MPASDPVQSPSSPSPSPSAAPAMPMPAPDPEERRGASDRRQAPEQGRRARRPSPWLRWLGVGGRDLGIIVFAVAAIVYSVRHVHPIFANQPTIAAELTRALPAAKSALAP